jgi:hypothetical protein
MLASPGLPFGRIEDTVVICVHPLELGGRPSCRSLLGTLDVLLSGEVAGGSWYRAYGSRAWWGRRLLLRLGEGSHRQQG